MHMDVVIPSVQSIPFHVQTSALASDSPQARQRLGLVRG